MTSNSYVSYICTGQTQYNFSLDINFQDGIDVIIDNKKVDSSLYCVNDIGTETQNIVFVDPIGTPTKQSILTLIKNLDIKRVTDFQNQTQISSDNLNLEFNNIINNSVIISDLLSRAVKINYNQDSQLFLPEPLIGCFLQWSENGDLINSSQSMSWILDSINNLQEQINNGGGGGEINLDKVWGAIDEINVKIDNFPDFTKEDFNNIQTDISSMKVDIKNIQDIINNGGGGGDITTLSSKNVVYSDGTMPDVATAFEALNGLYDTQKSLSSDIQTLETSNTDLNTKISDLENKLNNAIALINQKYTVVSHAILESLCNDGGYTAFLTKGKDNFSLQLNASKTTPFTVSFSNNSNINVVSVKDNLSLISKSTNLLYVYVDLDNDGSMKIGCTEKRPYYLSYMPVSGKTSNMILLDKYNFSGDFLHIPSLTMYSEKLEVLNRVYIGQAKFSSDGSSLEFVNNFALGNNVIFEYNIDNKNNQSLSFSNPFGTDAVLSHIYIKSDLDGYTSTEYNYDCFNYITNEDQVGNILKSGINYRISYKEIKVVTGQNFIQSIVQDSPISSTSNNFANLRFHVKRMF